MVVRGIRVEGLKELRRDLRALDNEGTWKAPLRVAAFNAANIVAVEARASAGRRTNPRMGSRAIATIRALAGQSRAQVAGGTASVVWFGGHEFGSGRFRQFPKRKAGGYNLYPALGRKRGQVVELYTREVGQLTRRYGLQLAA